MLPSPSNSSVTVPPAAQSGQLADFGTHMGGVAVCLQKEWQPEFFAAQEVFPVPSSTPRLLGVTQIKGEPVPVFAASHVHPSATQSKIKVPIVTLKWGSETIAITVDSEPQAVHLRGQAFAGAPEVFFAPALSQPQLGAGNEASSSHQVWWQLNIQELLIAITKH
jgi:chemotaxis signal transduction protein